MISTPLSKGNICLLIKSSMISTYLVRAMDDFSNLKEFRSGKNKKNYILGMGLSLSTLPRRVGITILSM